MRGLLPCCLTAVRPHPVQQPGKPAAAGPAATAGRVFNRRPAQPCSVQPGAVCSTHWWVLQPHLSAWHWDNHGSCPMLTSLHTHMKCGVSSTVIMNGNGTLFCDQVMVVITAICSDVDGTKTDLRICLLNGRRCGGRPGGAPCQEHFV
jgi:hypothetical protein